MKNFRSLLLPVALGAALLAPVAVLAQQAGQAPAQGVLGTAGQRHGHGRHRHRHGFMRMLKGVTLSDQQKTQMQQIMQQYRQAHPRGTLTDPQARKQAGRQLRMQLMDVLTPAQQAQVKQNMQQMRERRAQRGENEPSPEPSGSPEA